MVLVSYTLARPCAPIVVSVIFLLSTGTWKADPGDAGKIVSNALKTGFRHLDFAMMYGNQPEIGEALTAVFKEGKVKREDVWMTSKVLPPCSTLS